MTISGGHLIAGKCVEGHGPSFRAVNPATDDALQPPFHDAASSDIDEALGAAQAAFKLSHLLQPEAISGLLQSIASGIEALGDELVRRAVCETGLPEGRIVSERGRTIHQLLMFADLVDEGSWVDARIDTSDPQRQPIPKPDVRRILRPIGPVVIFGASNFPLAFSVAGGDTASALAAGNPVVFKAHPAHPGTSALVGEVIANAVKTISLPPGMFSLLQGAGHGVGSALVQHPLAEAVAFTGSLRGGRALFDLAARRPRPIPVMAEMGSINPVFLMPRALADRGASIAADLVRSVTLGVGQFCTKPGVVVAVAESALADFIEAVMRAMEQVPQSAMLYKALIEQYQSALDVLSRSKAVTALNRYPGGAVITVDGQDFISHPELRDELFGPATIIVSCRDLDQMLEVAAVLDGQLTATVHAEKEDLDTYNRLLHVLERCAGRIIHNGMPTGVEVCHAMHHGGPYPATTDGRFTSVGSAAIARFARPICYQNCPQSSLPLDLRDTNDRDILRCVNGQWQRGLVNLQ